VGSIVEKIVCAAEPLGGIASEAGRGLLEEHPVVEKEVTINNKCEDEVEYNPTRNIEVRDAILIVMHGVDEIKDNHLPNLHQHYHDYISTSIPAMTSPDTR
jgi:hypothetical protein